MEIKLFKLKLYKIHTHIIIQSLNFYDYITTRTFVSILSISTQIIVCIHVLEI